MAQLNLPFGVRVANNDPLDADRYIAPDITTRDLLITNGRAYVGLQVYVSGTTNKLYILKDMTPTWEEVGGAADISSLSTSLSIEISDRISADSSLTTVISTEISTRFSDDESLSTSISSEISDRMTADSSLSTIIDSGLTSISTVMSDDATSLSTTISSGFTVLSSSLSTESSFRISVDTSLSTAISTEASNRYSGDTSLSTSIGNKLSGLTSNLLYYDSVTKAYTPYADNIAAGTSGKFYLGPFPISNADLRLNYTGGLYVNSLSNNGIEGVSDNSIGVRGFSNNAEGISGLSNFGNGGTFSSSTGYGVFGSSNSVGGRFVTFGSTNALEAEGNAGVAAFIVKSSTLTSDDTNDLSNFTRLTDGDGLYGIDGDIISIIDDPVNVTYVSGSTFKATIGSDIRIDMNPRAIDSGSSIAYMFDTDTVLTSTDAKLLSLRNHGVDKFTVDKDGQVNVFNNRIVNVLTPTLNNDAANKAYVDSIAQGVSVHTPVHVVADSPITLSGSPTTIDGHIVVDGDFVLVAGQSNAAFNGIYVVTGTTWTRRPDADGNPNNEIELGDFVFVQSGVTYANTGWALGKTDAPTGQTYIIPDVDTQEWFKMAAVVAYTTDGQGIELSGGTTFYIELSGNTLTKSAGGLRVTDGIFLKRNEINSDFLYWDSGSSIYTPYPSHTSAATSGKFYYGPSLITPATDNRLNYTGGLYVNAVSTAIYGSSDGSYGVIGTSTNGVGGAFVGDTYTGMQATSRSGQAFYASKVGALTGDDASHTVYLSRVTSGNFNKTGNIIEIVDYPTGGGVALGSLLRASIDGVERINMNPRALDGDSATAYTFDTKTNITSAGSKLLSLKNSGTEKFYVDWSGNTFTSGVTISANTRRISTITLTSGVTTTWDMNLSCSAKVYLTGSTTLSISNTISGDNGTLVVIQGTSGNITFPSGSKYAGGTPPTLSGGGQLDILSFYYDGTNYYWNIGKNYA